jgi:MscS family membrane protein
MALVISVIAWTIWTPAQTNTNSVAVTVQSGQGVESVGTVVKLKESSLSFGLDKVESLQGQLGGFPLWQYTASLIYLVLAFVVAKLIDWLVGGVLKQWAAKTTTNLDNIVVELLQGPVRWLAFIIILQIGLQVFDWPVWVENYLRKFFIVLLACSFTYMILRLVDIVIRVLQARNAAKSDKHFNDLLFPLISKVLKGILVLIAILFTLDNLGLNIRSLIAGVSIGGLALGLAAQDTVGNLFGAASVFVDKPFQPGDRIQINGVDGTVEEIGLRSTRIRNLDGFLVTIPNKMMGSSVITNITRRPTIKNVFNFGFTYDTSGEKLAQAVEILRDVYKSHEKTHDVVIGFNRFGDSALNVEVVHFWKGTDHKEFVASLQKFNLDIKRRLAEAKIEFAFPTQTIYVKQEEQPPRAA